MYVNVNQTKFIVLPEFRLGPTYPREPHEFHVISSWTCIFSFS